MPVEIIDNGHNNEIIASPEFLANQSGKVIFKGDGSRLEIGDGSQMRGGQVQVWNASTVKIGSDCLLGFIDIFANRGADITVGNDVGFTWTVKLHAHEKATLAIGDGCLIAKDTLLTVSDMHSILDIKSGQRINPPRDVRIGERVWLAESVRVMKGVSIGDGSIVGACSMVTKSIPAGCLAVGSPASVVREGVTWLHELV